MEAPSPRVCVAVWCGVPCGACQNYIVCLVDAGTPVRTVKAELEAFMPGDADEFTDWCVTVCGVKWEALVASVEVLSSVL